MNRRSFAKLIGGVLVSPASVFGSSADKPIRVIQCGGPADSPPFCHKMDKAYFQTVGLVMFIRDFQDWGNNTLIPPK